MKTLFLKPLLPFSAPPSISTSWLLGWHLHPSRDSTIPLAILANLPSSTFAPLHIMICLVMNLGSCDASFVGATLAGDPVMDPVQTLPPHPSYNRQSIFTLHLGADDPCCRYPGSCLTVLGGQTRTRHSENNICLLWESFRYGGIERLEQASS